MPAVLLFLQREEARGTKGQVHATNSLSPHVLPGVLPSVNLCHLTEPGCVSFGKLLWGEAPFPVPLRS